MCQPLPESQPWHIAQIKMGQPRPHRFRALSSPPGVTGLFNSKLVSWVRPLAT